MTVKTLHKDLCKTVYVTAVTQYQCHFISRGKEWVVSYCTNRHTKKSNIRSTRTEDVLPIKHTHTQKNRNILLPSSNQAPAFKYALQRKILLGSCL